jgi:hypothetical protein
MMMIVGMILFMRIREDDAPNVLQIVLKRSFVATLRVE